MGLKLSFPQDDRPVRLSIDLPAALHRELIAYAEALQKENPGVSVEPAKLVAPMLSRFIASDRAFSKAKRQR